MKCPKPGCGGPLYRFQPQHLVAACYHADTGALMKLAEPHWKQVGLICGRCGYLEFYCQEPEKLVREYEDYFRNTEPEP